MNYKVLKRDIIEIADAIVINKIDGDSIEKPKIPKTEFSRVLLLSSPKENGWISKVLNYSSTNRLTRYGGMDHDF